MVSRYQAGSGGAAASSGSILDCIDIHVEVPRVDYEKLTDDRLCEPSESIRARVERARELQRQRFEGKPISCNADMGPTEVREICRLGDCARPSSARRTVPTWPV